MSKIVEKKPYFKPVIGFVKCRSVWFVMDNGSGDEGEDSGEEGGNPGGPGGGAKGSIWDDGLDDGFGW